jgi:hypothetical protein
VGCLGVGRASSDDLLPLYSLLYGEMTPRAKSRVISSFSFYVKCIFAVLGLELRAYALSHSSSSFL